MPNCSEQDIFVEQLIPNNALQKAAEWFNRQKISKMKSEDIEVDKPSNKDEDMIEIVQQLLIDATKEANKRNDDSITTGEARRANRSRSRDRRN